MNLSKKNKWVLALLLFIIGGYLVYQYAYQSHKTIEDTKAYFTGTSQDFLQKVQNDFDAWNNKTVELSGTITDKDENGITFNQRIYCQFREDFSSEHVNNHQNITLKGRVIGYDDLLEELKLDQCIIQP